MMVSYRWRRYRKEETVNETSAATTLEQVVDCYFAMWNETDPTARKAAIVSAWSPEASYIDPLLAAEWLSPSTSGSPAIASG